MVRSHCVANFVVGEGASGGTHGGATPCRERLTVAVNAAPSCSMPAFEAHAARQGGETFPVWPFFQQSDSAQGNDIEERGCEAVGGEDPLVSLCLSPTLSNDPLWEASVPIAL